MPPIVTYEDEAEFKYWDVLDSRMSKTVEDSLIEIIPVLTTNEVLSNVHKSWDDLDAQIPRTSAEAHVTMDTAPFPIQISAKDEEPSAAKHVNAIDTAIPTTIEDPDSSKDLDPRMRRNLITVQIPAIMTYEDEADLKYWDVLDSRMSKTVDDSSIAIIPVLTTNEVLSNNVHKSWDDLDAKIPRTSAEMHETTMDTAPLPIISSFSRNSQIFTEDEEPDPQMGRNVFNAQIPAIVTYEDEADLKYWDVLDSRMSKTVENSSIAIIPVLTNKILKENTIRSHKSWDDLDAEIPRTSAEMHSTTMDIAPLPIVVKKPDPQIGKNVFNAQIPAVVKYEDEADLKYWDVLDSRMSKTAEDSSIAIIPVLATNEVLRNNVHTSWDDLDAQIPRTSASGHVTTMDTASFPIQISSKDEDPDPQLISLRKPIPVVTYEDEADYKHWDILDSRMSKTAEDSSIAIIPVLTTKEMLKENIVRSHKPWDDLDAQIPRTSAEMHETTMDTAPLPIIVKKPDPQIERNVFNAQIPAIVTYEDEADPKYWDVLDSRMSKTDDSSIAIIPVLTTEEMLKENTICSHQSWDDLDAQIPRTSAEMHENTMGMGILAPIAIKDTPIQRNISFDSSTNSKISLNKKVHVIEANDAINSRTLHQRIIPIQPIRIQPIVTDTQIIEQEIALNNLPTIDSDMTRPNEMLIDNTIRSYKSWDDLDAQIPRTSAEAHTNTMCIAIPNLIKSNSITSTLTYEHEAYFDAQTADDSSIIVALTTNEVVSNHVHKSWDDLDALIPRTSASFLTIIEDPNKEIPYEDADHTHLDVFDARDVTTQEMGRFNTVRHISWDDLDAHTSNAIFVNANTNILNKSNSARSINLQISRKELYEDEAPFPIQISAKNEQIPRTSTSGHVTTMDTAPFPIQISTKDDDPDPQLISLRKPIPIVTYEDEADYKYWDVLDSRMSKTVDDSSIAIIPALTTKEMLKENTIRSHQSWDDLDAQIHRTSEAMHVNTMDTAPLPIISSLSRNSQIFAKDEDADPQMGINVINARMPTIVTYEDEADLKYWDILDSRMSKTAEDSSIAIIPVLSTEKMLKENTIRSHQSWDDLDAQIPRTSAEMHENTMGMGILAPIAIKDAPIQRNISFDSLTNSKISLNMNKVHVIEANDAINSRTQDQRIIPIQPIRIQPIVTDAQIIEQEIASNNLPTIDSEILVLLNNESDVISTNKFWDAPDSHTYLTPDNESIIPTVNQITHHKYLDAQKSNTADDSSFIPALATNEVHKSWDDLNASIPIRIAPIIIHNALKQESVRSGIFNEVSDLPIGRTTQAMHIITIHEDIESDYTSRKLVEKTPASTKFALDEAHVGNRASMQVNYDEQIATTSTNWPILTSPMVYNYAENIASLGLAHEDASNFVELDDRFKSISDVALPRSQSQDDQLSNFAVSGWDDDGGDEDFDAQKKHVHGHDCAISCYNEQNAKAMMNAAEHGHLKQLKKFIEMDEILVHYRDKDGYTPLHRACYGNHINCVDYLLNKGANISARTEMQWQCLHSCCQWNHKDIAARLIQNGADVNARSEGGQTPLHVAAAHGGSYETAQLLLMHPYLDAEILNNSHDTAMDIARRNCKFYNIFEMADPLCKGIDD